MEVCDYTVDDALTQHTRLLHVWQHGKLWPFDIHLCHDSAIAIALVVNTILYMLMDKSRNIDHLHFGVISHIRQQIVQVISIILYNLLYPYLSGAF